MRFFVSNAGKKPRSKVELLEESHESERASNTPLSKVLLPSVRGQGNIRLAWLLHCSLLTDRFLCFLHHCRQKPITSEYWANTKKQTYAVVHVWRISPQLLVLSPTMRLSRAVPLLSLVTIAASLSTSGQHPQRTSQSQPSRASPASFPSTDRLSPPTPGRASPSTGVFSRSLILPWLKSRFLRAASWPSEVLLLAGSDLFYCLYPPHRCSFICCQMCSRMLTEPAEEKVGERNG